MAVKGGAAAASLVVIVVMVMVAGGQASAAMPNDWSSCMKQCMSECTGFFPAYCAGGCSVQCAFSIDDAPVVDNFCNLGCVSSKCAADFSSNSNHEGCLNDCAGICTTPNPIKLIARK